MGLIEAFVLGLFIGGVLGAWVVMMGTMAGFDGVVHMPDESSDREFEHEQRRQRARMRSVVGDDEHGTVRTDLAAFAALLLCMALVGAAIWAASGWWG